MQPSCFPFLSHENTIEGNTLLQQPQLLKTRVNMSFVTLPSLCKLTASGSAQSCTFIRITKSQEIQVQNWCSRKCEFYHASLGEWVLTNQQAAERQLSSNIYLSAVI